MRDSPDPRKGHDDFLLRLNPGPTRPDSVLEFICQNLVELSPNLVVFSSISGLKTHHFFGRLNDFVFWVGLKKIKG